MRHHSLKRASPRSQNWATRAGTAENGVLAVVRSYEGGLGTALTAQGFTPIGDLRLAVRDTRARVTAPGMLPAIG